MKVLKEGLDGLGNSPVFLLAGDLSYADGFNPRWDTWSMMFEPLLSKVQMISCVGNHEVRLSLPTHLGSPRRPRCYSATSQVSSSEQFVNYDARFPTPYKASGSTSPHWFSKEVGPVHVISLCSYCATYPGSWQYEWLVSDFESIDREKTPWVIVMTHAPWYNSNTAHQGEAEPHRVDMEELLYDNGVDIFVNGHVHSYERSIGVYNGCLNECAPNFITLGDGGNYEGTYYNWIQPPPWSVVRESSFGVAFLEIENATHAYWNWTRQGCEKGPVPASNPPKAVSILHDGPPDWAIDLDPECEGMLGGGWSTDRFSADRTWIVRPEPSKRKPAANSACPAKNDAPCTFPPYPPAPPPPPGPPPDPPAPPPRTHPTCNPGDPPCGESDNCMCVSDYPSRRSMLFGPIPPPDGCYCLPPIDEILRPATVFSNDPRENECVPPTLSRQNLAVRTPCSRHLQAADPHGRQVRSQEESLPRSNHGLYRRWREPAREHAGLLLSGGAAPGVALSYKCWAVASRPGSATSRRPLSLLWNGPLGPPSNPSNPVHHPGHALYRHLLHAT